MYRVHLSLPELNRQCCADFEISTTLFVGTILVKIDVLNTCGAMICSYFRIVMRFHRMYGQSEMKQIKHLSELNKLNV